MKIKKESLHLLILEDNPADAELAIRELKKEGFVVEWSLVETEEAFREALNQKPEIILADYNLPSFDGLSALKIKQEIVPEIPLVILSGTIGEESAVECIKSGATDYVLKDKLSRLGPVVERALEEARLYRERRQARESLRESEERYRNLIESTYDLIQSVTPDGCFLFVNRAWQETLGYTKVELPSINLWKIIHPQSLSYCQEIFSQVIEGKSIKNIQATFVAKDGSPIQVEGNVTGRYMGGKLIATHGFFHDITERKQSEEKLRQSYKKLRKMLKDIVQTVALTVEIRDPYTAGHQQRVSQLASAIARQMNLSPNQVEGIYMTAILHDIGKISIPAEILTKPGRLTEIEMNMLKTHPEVGYDILKRIDFPWPLAKVVLQHHERRDGSGYPKGLKGDEILIEARIMGVADVVEAMSSHRPYRPALGIDKALEEISQNRGILYDPEVVDTCLKLFKEKGFKF
ncbi:PAS domain S-box protein [bacterium]|nr:PAS domain S-box protein [bacterium]MBU4509933.1 PAS domain S-box protein [bacterium]